MRHKVVNGCYALAVCVMTVMMIKIFNGAENIIKIPKANIIREKFLAENPDIKVDLIVFGYARGGSTYVGQMLGYNDDTFYFYEPLYTNERPLKYYSKDALCGMNDPGCRLIGRQEVSKIIKKIESCFTCDNEVLGEFIIDWQNEKSGKAWKNNNLTKSCYEAKYRVAKVLRLSAELVIELLLRNPRLKVLYLYRDPRGIINSRQHLRSVNNKWIFTTDGLAKGLCLKMEKDFVTFSKLKQENAYNQRILFSDYESIAKDPIGKSAFIFSYFGIHLSQQYQDSISNLGNSSKKFDNVWNTAFRSDGYASSIRWRSELSSNDKIEIDKHCHDVYKLLGYEL